MNICNNLYSDSNSFYLTKKVCDNSNDMCLIVNNSSWGWILNKD